MSRKTRNRQKRLTQAGPFHLRYYVGFKHAPFNSWGMIWTSAIEFTRDYKYPECGGDFRKRADHEHIVGFDTTSNVQRIDGGGIHRVGVFSSNAHIAPLSTAVTWTR